MLVSLGMTSHLKHLTKILIYSVTDECQAGMGACTTFICVCLITSSVSLASLQSLRKFFKMRLGSDMTTEGSLAGKILPAPLAHEGKVILQPLAAAPPPQAFLLLVLSHSLPLLFLVSFFLPFDLPTSFNILNTAGQTACQATGNSRRAPDGQSRPVNKRRFCMSQTCFVKWTKLLCHRRVSVNAQIRQARVWDCAIS